MVLLIAYITLWAVSPGPVFVMTIHQAKKSGSLAGIAVSGGATVIAALMVVTALLIHTTGFSSILFADSMAVVEQAGAVGIVLMGLYAAFKCLRGPSEAPEQKEITTNSKAGFVKGMAMMATGIPQALLYYNVILPQTVDLDAIIKTIIALGIVKVILIFTFHSGVALATTRAQNIVGSNRFGKVLEIGLAFLIMGMGINLLI